MPIKRLAVCDICGTVQAEEVSSSGWKGWAIINGISMEEPVGTLTDKNTQTMLCESCKLSVATFLDSLKAEVK